MKWERKDGIYYSKDERFVILKATDKLYYGRWELFDEKTREKYHGDSLKHAKQIAENMVNK